jgi:Uma2 family endonuclease
MPAAPIPRVAREEYLRQERLAPFRSEYYAGHIFAMSGASRPHNRIVTNLSTSLDVQLRDRPCNVYSNDMRVSVRGGQFYLYPDVVVTCGQERFEDGVFDTLLNPVVIIEVLSSSTEAYDRGEKFHAYRSIPSLREYVLITQSPRRFEIYRKQDDGSWRYESWAFSMPPLVLQSIDCTLAPDQVYFKVEDEIPGDQSAGEQET